MKRQRRLGEVLVQLGFVTDTEINSLQESLTNATKEEKWGLQLIAHGVITQSQLQRALDLLGDLSCEDKEKRGSAASELAVTQAANVVSFAERVRVKAAGIGARAAKRRYETGEQHPAISAGPLAEKI